MFFTSIAIASFLLSLTDNTISHAFVVRRDVSPATTSELQTGWTYQGCYSDNNGGVRALSGANTADNTKMDAATCIQYCYSKGFVYAGTEYSAECWCDNSIATNAVKQTDASCSMACSGDATEACGGPNLLTVYYANKAPPNPADAVNAAAISPFKYQGCYTDNSPNGRSVKFQEPDSNTLSVESCVATCKSKGYTIAGMEYSSQCFCDNYIRYSPTLVADTKCNMACSGNSLQKCGAGGYISIYSNGTMTPYVPAAAQKTGLPGSWTYKGCLSDKDQPRSLPYLIESKSNNSNVNCLTQCQLFGYGAAGTEYGEQCFCGDVQNVIDAGATLQAEPDCNMVCSADENKNGGYYCGGANRLSYYTWNGTTPLNKWNFATGNAAGKYQFLLSGPTIPLVTAPGRNGKVTYMEKFGTSPANNGTGAYEFDPSLVGTAQNPWREMHVKSDIFCSASLTLPDKVGRQINIGGWADPSTHGIRLYWPDGKPGTWGVNDWEENGDQVKLLDGRWYPTAMTMSNGSILVMGGQVGSNGAPVPTLEVLPTPPGVTKSVYCDYLERTDPYNLYPYLAVLPSGGIFVAYYNEARVLDPVTLQTIKLLPNIPGAVNDPNGGRSYPFEGTAMILPQRATDYTAMTVMICGGSNPYAEIGLDNCVSINPDDAAPHWTIERMPSKRVMSCITALPDGTYMINNGAQLGRAGFGLATQPNLNSVLYDPRKTVNQRMTVMANTTIARLYHSESVLLDDGRVLVSGSDPEDVREFAPQEYRNEVWIPPYLTSGAARPKFTITNYDWTYGQTVKFTITQQGSGAVSSYKVSLIGAVASTHGNSMGQRTYFPKTTCSGSTCTLIAPPNANVCPPSWFQVFLLDANNVPSSATWVRIGGDPAKLGNWPTGTYFTKPGTGVVTPL